MASQAQIAANRANALKSTGPTSEQGKRRIASNALKHGLYSDTRINLFNEDHDFVKTLLTDLQGEYCPVTPTEHILVQQLATLQTRFLRAQTHYLALIDNQAEDMYLDLKEKFVVDPDTDSRYALAFEKQSQSSRALEILSREIDRLPNKIRKTIEMLVWYRSVPAAEPAEIEEQSQIEQDLPKQARPQHYPAPDEDISLEEFNRAIIEAVERHGLHIPQEVKEQINT